MPPWIPAASAVCRCPCAGWRGWSASPSWSSAGGFMSLHHVEVGTCHVHLCLLVPAAWAVSCCNLHAGALTCRSGCSWDRGLAGRRAYVGDVWGRNCQAGVAWDAPGGLPCCNHVLCQMGLVKMCRSCSRHWLIASPAVLERCGGGGMANDNMLWSRAAHSEAGWVLLGAYPSFCIPGTGRGVWKCSSLGVFTFQ